jgi:hypothetical protein
MAPQRRPSARHQRHLPNGTKVTGVDDLRNVLVKERPRFTRTLIEQFLMPLGRDPDHRRRVLIADLITKLDADHHRFSTLITGVVTPVLIA